MIKSFLRQEASLFSSPLVRPVHPLDIGISGHIQGTQLDLVRLHLKPRSNLHELDLIWLLVARGVSVDVVAKGDKVAPVGKGGESSGGRGRLWHGKQVFKDRGYTQAEF